MIARSSVPQALLLAAALCALLTTTSARAQQPEAAKPAPIMQPQPTPVPGRPDIPNAEVNTARLP